MNINTRFLSWGAAVLFLGVAIPMIHAASKGQDSPARASETAPAPQVGVMRVEQHDILRTTELAGRTTAFMTSEVRPQVNGVIQKRLFHEGSEVTQGQQLYQIDPASYVAAYESAKAELARGEATLKTARAKEGRYKTLIGEKVISQQEYDDVLAIAKQTEADIASARSKIDLARINLEYTKVLSPITGRIGHSAVTSGALVTANQATALTTVISLDPIYVDVNQSVATMLRLRKALDAGELEQDGDGAAKVTLKLEDGSTYDYTGKLQFSEVTVDKGTGTVLLRAIFPNPKHLLFPGMYVHAAIQEGVNRNAITVPQKAVSRGSQGEASVLVLESGDTVARRPVELGPDMGDSWIVYGGLASGDRVLVDGFQNVRPGMAVRPVELDASQAAQAASVTAGAPGSNS